jgi:hypothetical protein
MSFYPHLLLNGRYKLRMGIVFLGLVVLGSRPVAAIETDTQIWSQYVTQGALSGNVKGYFEFQPRYSLGSGSLEAAIARIALGYTLSEHFTVWLGYGWTPRLSPTYTTEDRIYQQLNFSTRLGAWTLSSRSRFEERFLGEIGQASHRARELIRLTHPIIADGTLQGVFWEELFINTNKTALTNRGGFDQNRVFLGINTRIHPDIQLEPGYLFVYVNRPLRPHDRIIHGPFISIFSTF